MSENAASGWRRNRPGAVRVAVVGLLLPLMAAAVLVWSVSHRQEKLDRIPVAVVNNDKILTDPQPMAAGRALTASLTDPKPGTTKLDWTLTDTKDATTGLKSGTYYAVLTIPSDFSSAIVSSGTDKPVRGQVQLVSNSAASTTVPYISDQVVAAAATSLGNQTTQGYLKNVYDGFNQIAKSNSSAASSAASLADGTAQVSEGAAQLDDGTSELADSLGQVASGSASLQAGTASVASGAVEVQNGVAGVSSGAGKLHTGAADLAKNARTLARDSGVLADKAKKVATGAAGVSAATARLESATRRLTGELNRLTGQCVAQGGSVQFCAQLARARNHALVVAVGSGLVDRLAGRVATADAALARGAGALARGNGKLSGGTQKLSSASGDLSRSAKKLLTGATSVAQGAVEVNDAAVQLEGGTQQTSSAATSLASGSESVSSGASSANSGAHQLSSGLEKGAKQSPTYSSSQQNALAIAVSEPVQLSHSLQHTKHGNGWLLAAIVAVILWLAALVGALGVDLSAVRRHALAPLSSRRLAFTQALPVLGVALVQVVAVLVAMWLFRASVAEVVPFALLTVLAAVTFSLLGHALRLALGGAGIMIFVLFLLVQVAALGNVIPLETAPSVLRTLNGLLPLTAFTNAASQLVSGGDVGSLLAVVIVLVLWGLAACAVLLVSVKRQRMMRSSPRPTATDARAMA
jgi:putative membrane protein